MEGETASVVASGVGLTVGRGPIIGPYFLTNCLMETVEGVFISALMSSSMYSLISLSDKPPF